LEDWPAPSLIDRVLFENYWPGLVLFGMLALVIGFRALRLRSRRMGAAAALLAIWAAAIVPLTFAVTTTREMLIQQTRDLVVIVMPPLADQQLAPMLTEDVQIGIISEPNDPIATGRDEIVAMANRAQTRYAIEHWSFGRVEARATDPARGESFLRLNTNLSMGQGIAGGTSFPVSSEWLIQWERAKDGRWCVSKVQCVKIAGRNPSRGELP
jgi:hypothetical protein